MAEEIIMTTLLKYLFWSMVLLTTISWHTTADAAQVHHDLNVRLDLARQQLTGEDTITIENAAPGPLTLRLAPQARIDAVTLNAQPIEYRFRGGMIHLLIPPATSSNENRIAIRYQSRFDYPAPVRPTNTDNPGHGVTGTISPAGVLLLSGAGWLPAPLETPATYSITVNAPKGIVAVTAGSSLGVTHRSDRTISYWRIARNTIDGPSLSAGAYEVRQKQVGTVTVATYLTAANADLAERYLEASARYIGHFARLFGPYPFAKFAVVENFFPTGYGFPSYTLMGGRVLRLPFIVQTSLSHEIAHCWWGNGVLVDYSEGNWCEGLTAYVADYYNKEQQGAEAAKAHRQRWLRNYANLVNPQNDFPLVQFKSRTDRATQTIGYDKAAMVFHMLRQLVGDERFWSTLRDLYQQFIFREMSWQDIQRAFAQARDDSLAWFFRQWVFEKGAPQLRLEQVTRTRSPQGWVVSGRVVQTAPVFELNTVIQVQTTDGQTHPLSPSINHKSQILPACGMVGTNHKLTISADQTPFKITVDHAPTAVQLDPDMHLFRRLDPIEVPNTVNTLKGAKDRLVVFTQGVTPELRRQGSLLVASLGVKGATFVDETSLDQLSIQDRPLLFIGRPRDLGLLTLLPDLVAIKNDHFQLAGTVFQNPADAFFMVAGEPGHPQALFWPLSAEAASEAWRKITHYGNYSYLAFRGGRNLQKGIWPVVASPVRFLWAVNQAP
jgi:hypothetical protein